MRLRTGRIGTRHIDRAVTRDHLTCACVGYLAGNLEATIICQMESDLLEGTIVIGRGPKDRSENHVSSYRSVVLYRKVCEPENR